MSNTYGVSVTDILAAIRQNRALVTFWADKGMPTIAANHAANVRDLRVMLLNVRFPNNTLPVDYADDFSPFIVVSPDVVSPEDTEAFIDALTDAADEMATDVPYLTGQDLINA